MAVDRPILVYGPAYVDTIVEIDGPLVPGATLDQSLYAVRREPRDDGRIVLLGPTGDALAFPVPGDAAATYWLSEPLLARLQGQDARTIACEYAVTRFARQLGGMGAGYAKALQGTVRIAIGDDPEGAAVLGALAAHQIPVLPTTIPGCHTDTSLVILSPQGDKLAVGVRDAMVRWRADRDARAAGEDVLIFCGAPNALMREVLVGGAEGIVMCAPAMRNVRDTAVPLASLAEGISYLTLNALEWANLPDAARCRSIIPVITITQGPLGSMVLLRGGAEVHVPADRPSGPVDTNRAGETYGATFLRTLLREAPDFPSQGVSPALAEYAARYATQQATRQLAITGFGFPEER